MVELSGTPGRNMLRHYAAAVEALDRILDAVDDDEVAAARGLLVRRYLDLLADVAGPYDQQRREH